MEYKYVLIRQKNFYKEECKSKYLKIRVNQSQKELIPGSGTNLYMGDAESSTLIMDESIVIEKRLALERQKRRVNIDLVEQKNVVNVLAGFPNSGYDISEWTDKKKFVFPIILFILTLIIFTFLGLKNFLEKEIK